MSGFRGELMVDDKGDPVSGVSILHYIDTRIGDFKDLVKSSKEDSERAAKVLEATTIRAAKALDLSISRAQAASNEIRGAMTDAANKFPDKDTVDARVEGARNEARQAIQTLTAQVNSINTTIPSLASSDDLSKLKSRLDGYDGRIIGISIGVGTMTWLLTKFVLK